MNLNQSKTKNIAAESTFKTVEIISVRQLKKKYSTSCSNITLTLEFTIEKSNSIIKTKSLPNMPLAYNKLEIKTSYNS